METFVTKRLKSEEVTLMISIIRKYHFIVSDFLLFTRSTGVVHFESKTITED